MNFSAYIKQATTHEVVLLQHALSIVAVRARNAQRSDSFEAVNAQEFHDMAVEADKEILRRVQSHIQQDDDEPEKPSWLLLDVNVQNVVGTYDNEPDALAALDSIRRTNPGHESDFVIQPPTTE